MPTRSAYAVEYLHRPGRRLSPARLDALVAELRDIAGSCFDAIPEYQVLTGDRDALDAAVLTLARRPDGRLAGFCAARLFDVPGVGEVFHLGLTCVGPDDRGAGLTHVLLSNGITRYLVLHRPLRGAWFSNVASVLSSLGNVALYFEDVHPSPFRQAEPSPTHVQIARWLSERHRGDIHLRPEARLDEDRFVFRGANAGTCFGKSSTDAQYHHRDPELTRWYDDLCDLDAGDAVLQIGRISLVGFARYASRTVSLRIPGLRRLVPARPMIAGPRLGRA